MADRRSYGSADQPTDLTAHKCPDQRTKWLAITKPDFHSDRHAHCSANGCADCSALIGAICYADEEPHRTADGSADHRTAVGSTYSSAKQDPDSAAVVVAQRETHIRPFLPVDDRSAVHAGRWLLQAV